MSLLVGELFDKNRAISLVHELRSRNLPVEMTTLSTDQGVVYQIICLDDQRATEASEFFRVRMGLPGPAPEPDPEWIKLKKVSMGFGTKALLLPSVALYLVSLNRPAFEKILPLLFFNDPQLPLFESLLRGEIWRLVTPIFLHFGILHILFNGMWIKDLGSYFESQKGTKSFFIFILVAAIFSNTLQYVAMGRPEFGGLSGIVYAFLGQTWIEGKIDDNAHFKLPKIVVIQMIGWYLLCLTGAIGNIANIAHGVGLSVGMIWGLFPWKPGKLKERVLYLGLAIFFSLGTLVIEIIRLKFQ